MDNIFDLTILSVMSRYVYLKKNTIQFLKLLIYIMCNVKNVDVCSIIDLGIDQNQDYFDEN